MSDTSGRYVDANAAAVGLLGYSREELLSMTVGDVVVGDDGWVDAEFARLMRAGYWHGEVTVRPKDGPSRVVDAEASLLRLGETCRYLAILRPIDVREPLEDFFHLTESRLAAVVDSAVDGIVCLDSSQRVIVFNAAAERMFGRPARDTVGRSLDVLLPPSYREPHAEHIRRFGETGVTTRNMGAQLGTLFGLRADGTEFPVEVTISQVGEGAERIFTAIIRDATERLASEGANLRLHELEREATERAELAKARTERLQTVTASLGTAVTSAQVADILLTQGLAASGAVAGMILLPGEADSLEVAGALGYTAEFFEGLTPIDAGAELPAARAFRSNTAFWIEGQEEIIQRFPLLLTTVQRLDSGSIGALPLSAGDQVVGGISLHFPRSRELKREDRGLVLAIARQCGQALQRALLFEAEQTARLEAEQASARVSALQRITAKLVDVETESDLAHVLLHEVAKVFDAVAAAVVRPIDEQWLAIVDSLGYPLDAAESLSPFRRDLASPMTDALESGSAVVVESEEELLARYPGLEGEQSALGYGSIIAIPLMVAGRAIGGVGLHLSDYRVFDERDRALLVAIAQQAAQAAHRAQLRESERESEARVRRLVDSNVIGTVVGDSEWILDANDAFLEMLGYSHEDLQRRELNWRQLTPEEFIARSEAAIKEMLERGAATPYEKEFYRKDGSRVPILLGLALLEAEPFRAIGFALDLTERKGAEAERLLLLDQERAARTEAEAARERLGYLAKATEVLGSSLDYRYTLQQLATTAVPGLADWCAVDVLDERGELRLVAIAHVDPNKVEIARRLREEYPQDPDAPNGTWAVIRSGRAEMVSEITSEMIEGAIESMPELREIIRGLELRSSIVVPLAASGRAFGAITLLRAESGGKYGADDLALAEELAKRASIAIEHARLYEERSQVADILEKSLLPPAFPQVPGAEIAGRYLPSGDAAQVGGDFYDVFQAGDGNWVVGLGDVCGKGTRAAAVMALARYTIRTAALSESLPSKVLKVLNDALLHQEEDQRFCTVCSLRIRSEPGEGLALTTSCGGHPLPLVLRGDGTVSSMGEPGTLLGVFEDPVLRDQDYRLAPGDSLLMYTDGITDERGADGTEFGEDRVRQVLASCSQLDADAIADRIVASVQGYNAGPPRDDIAVLVIRAKP